ncbi:MAG: DUF3795 domain-containing protein [Candidatus Ratteibacteria bacterium]|nr:DUF3795 domain-containing protein [Candidatus Ratteibacteria bacterium]
MDKPLKTYPTIACCGLDCGLCPRFYTVGPSRCPGCVGPNFFNKHPTCSFITCCVKKKGLEVCGQCSEFPCPKFKSEEEYLQWEGSSSYPSPKKIPSNLNFIKKHGIEKFILQQKKRINLLETMLKDFDDGRSRSFFCRAACLLSLADLTNSLDKATHKIKTAQIRQNDVKNKAKILKEIINEIALKERVELFKKK